MGAKNVEMSLPGGEGCEREGIAVCHAGVGVGSKTVTGPEVADDYQALRASDVMVLYLREPLNGGSVCAA